VPDRTCRTCGERPARRNKGVPVCDECRAVKAREVQRRYHGRADDSYQSGFDTGVCLWCEESKDARPYRVLRPVKFCSDRCRHAYRNAMRSLSVAERRRCRCGQPAVNARGVPVCHACRDGNRKRLVRERTLRPYGITPGEYDELLARQGGGCAICGATDSGRNGQPLCVDHCHVTGAVRALLCVKCNTAVGMVRDSPAIAQALLRYVTEHAQLRLIS
jgi:hypothetical protein